MGDRWAIAHHGHATGRSIIEIEIEGTDTNAFDRLLVSGGMLVSMAHVDFILSDAFIPSTGDIFRFVETDGLTGADTLSCAFLNPVAGMTYHVIETNAALELHVAHVPSVSTNVSPSGMPVNGYNVYGIPVNDLADDDADGLNNAEEHELGLDPTRDDSRIDVRLNPVQLGSNTFPLLELGWYGSEGQMVDIVQSFDVNHPGSVLVSNIVSDQDYNTFNVSMSDTNQTVYYRLRRHKGH